MEIPFQSLKVQSQRIKADFLREVGLLIDSASYILTDHVKTFEDAWAKYCGQKYCVGVSSGTDALYLALLALGRTSTTVSVSKHAYYADAEAIIRARSIPFYLDDPELVVHLYGEPTPTTDTTILEDCAQIHGYKPKITAAWSFYPTKTLGAFGDAGAVTTNDKDVYERLLALRNLGQVGKNVHDYRGGTFRMDSIQAIALSLQLQFLEDDLKEKRELCDRYASEFGNYIEHINPKYPHIFPIFVDHRDDLRERLAKKGIATMIHYPTVAWKHKACQSYCEDTEQQKIFDRELSLPLFLGMTDEQQDYVCKTIKICL